MKQRALGSTGWNVSALGLGGMYLSITGRPSEKDAIATVHSAIAMGVTLIDTANVYCLDDDDLGHNERLIGKAIRSYAANLQPGNGVTVATKGGLRRPKGNWSRHATPESLRSSCEGSLLALGVGCLDVYQLHAPDPAVPFEKSVETLAQLQREGKIKHVGLSNVTVEELQRAQAIVPIVSVQNRWNPQYRVAETSGMIDYCTKHNIAFLPYSPFGGASGAKTLANVGSLGTLAASRNVSVHRLVLAWMLAKSPVIIPIPGARRVESVRDSFSADSIELSSTDMLAIEQAFTK